MPRASTTPPQRPPSPATAPSGATAVAEAVRDRSRGAQGPTVGAERASGSEFAPLLRTVKEQGLLAYRKGWYARGIGVNLLCLAGVVAGMFAVGGSWWVLLLAPVLAVFSARTAFIGHDAGHAQITGDRRISRIIQLVHGNVLLGMSQEWWNDKHNRHHANPNHIDKDPDVVADVLVFTQHQAVGRTGFRGWLTRHQALLFFPLTTLEGIALKVYGFQSVFDPNGPGRTARARVVEGLLLAVHVVGYVALLLASMPVGQALVFGLVHQMLFGLHLGMAFAPNHKGMEMVDAETGKGWGHLRRQVLTSRNIRGGRVTDWLLGGLNYQVEHHLFPSMPRPHLRLVQPLVRAHCRRLALPYVETGLVESYRQALAHMREVGEPLRQGA
ncbi:acyl-CoA desaturase [Streptomyces sp. NPDC047315]|uniref:fatty acid desaturase family protein n=1 Tax=Streptomyces sp. NPDC047315 TaxID=3155142 RepID=UPI0033D5D770